MFKKNRLSKLKQKIIEAGIFDSIFYLRENSDVRMYDGTPLEHFISIGMHENRKPNDKFESIWYTEFYRDVRENGINAVEHYARYGYRENRFINAMELAAYRIISDSGLFDEHYYLSHNDDLQKHKRAGLDLLLHFIRYGADEKRNPNVFFDTEWYLQRYPDVSAAEQNPLVHYILHGQTEGRYPSPQTEPNSEIAVEPPSGDMQEVLAVSDMQSEQQTDEHERFLYQSIAAFSLDWSEYFSSNSHPFSHSDPIDDYIKNWAEYEPLIPGFFDTNFYLAFYPDIKTAGLNPLFHYLTAGKQEGRLGYFDTEKYLQTGCLPYDSNKETVIFVSHESSATGAPLLGYNIVDGLSIHFNIVHIVIKKSNINNIISKNCFVYVEEIPDKSEFKAMLILKSLAKKYTIKAVVLNSVETFPVLRMAGKLRLPTISLIHEFSDYTRPIGKMVNTMFYATEVITPATIIKNSMLEELKMLTGIDNQVKHLSLFPQGKLPYLPDTFGDEDSAEELYKKLNITNIAETKIVVGSGYVQVRKGVDLFLSVARYIKKNFNGKCKFIWVGDGYNPENDFSCSVWLKRDIKFYGLEEDFIFLEHQKSLDVVFTIADIFCLTSRMDPFPNVAIDAMEKNVPIACFKDASGTEEFVQKFDADYMLADYLDTYGLAYEIIHYFNKNQRKKTINAELVTKELSFDSYMHSIVELIEKASKSNQQTIESAQKIIDAQMLDLNYYGLAEDMELGAYYYVSLYKKGLHQMSPNPKPGFSQLGWILEHGAHEKLTPLEQAINLHVDHTHVCKSVPMNPKEITPVEFKYAVHLHLYYIDLADVFKEYFMNLVGNFDLYITIVRDKDVETVYRSFQGCGAANIKVVVVDNIGRDVGPMIFHLRNQLMTNDYAVVGHFHSKKSLSTDGELGNRWREYLMQNLCGGNGIAKSVLSLFNDPQIGLVFAEDKHIVDIGDNRRYVDDLCDMLDVPRVGNAHIFPLGNMFWARLEAIRQFFDLDPEKLLQPEPLPYDGSYMHAIERISPNLVAKNGFKFVTVYKSGSAW